MKENKRIFLIKLAIALSWSRWYMQQNTWSNQLINDKVHTRPQLLLQMLTISIIERQNPCPLWAHTVNWVATCNHNQQMRQGHVIPITTAYFLRRPPLQGLSDSSVITMITLNNHMMRAIAQSGKTKSIKPRRISRKSWKEGSRRQILEIRTNTRELETLGTRPSTETNICPIDTRNTSRGKIKKISSSINRVEDKIVHECREGVVGWLQEMD